MPNLFKPRAKRPTRRRRFSIKRLAPSNLFGRALLILVLPMVLSQIIITHVFYDRHWSSVERNLANSVASDLLWLQQTYERDYQEKDHASALKATQSLGRELGIPVNFEASGPIAANKGKELFPELYANLSQRLRQPVSIRVDESRTIVRVRLNVSDGVLMMQVNRKMITSSTTLIFILWMVGSSLLLTMIAILFLRNQIKPIVALAYAAERLGLGQDVDDFRPRGASEVRRAGRAFVIMAERLRRQVQNRTDMLAGISHDLRTPLTRMKLELELATMPDTTRDALAGDIDEMGKMIDEYLDFARGDAGESPEPVDLDALLHDIVSDYRRSKRHVSYLRIEPMIAMIRPQAMRRAITNLIDNALRYGGQAAAVTLEQSATFIRIKIADEGPGIAESEHEHVFKPFTRIEPSRNHETGGVGLGLSIARAVAQHHGGDVTLENIRALDGSVRGLEVTLRIPRAVQTTA